MNALKNKWFLGISLLLIGFIAGYLVNDGGKNTDKQHVHEQEAGQTIWTCSMHPQIRKNEAGDCPICGMELIPLGDKEEAGPNEIRMSPTAMQLANVQTSIIGKETPVKEIRLEGKVQPDERKLLTQTTHISGRIERLLVNYTGEQVRKGQVLAYVYSPELVTAQEELFQAYAIRNDQPELYRASRQKLRNWKLSEKQINGILQAGKPRLNFPILADVSGVVIDRKVNLGDHVKGGQPLFEIADLSSVWILFDVYESELSWVKQGDKVEFVVQGLPASDFEGEISFVDPVIDPKTRVAKARVQFSNKSGQLKPEMFATGILKSKIDGDENLIVVPKSAVMWTGKRSVVYVKTSSDQGTNFTLREVVLGPVLGEGYVIESGLSEGEEIATSGTFSIDASAQLAGKPSMMMQKEKPLELEREAKEALGVLFQGYLNVKDALLMDDFNLAQKQAKGLSNDLEEVRMHWFKGESRKTWMKYSNPMASALSVMESAKNLEEGRDAFQLLSNQFVGLAKAFGSPSTPLFIQHCPMAGHNQGADWISGEREVRNPYFGESMLKCGEVTDSVMP